MNLREKIHQALVFTKENGPQFAHSGICATLEHEVKGHTWWQIEDELAYGFQEWPKFSGNNAYPVPGRNDDGEEIHHAIAFCESSDEAMWSGNHPYGALRLELLDFLIDFFAEKASA